MGISNTFLEHVCLGVDKYEPKLLSNVSLLHPQPMSIDPEHLEDSMKTNFTGSV